MTEIQPAHYTDGACHTAQGDRQILSSLVCGEGVAIGANGGADLEVVQRAAGANMSVDVGSGNAFIEGTDVGWQGMYHVSNDGTINVALAAADPTDDRIDLIVATVRDATYSGTDRDWLIQRVTGTPSPAPTPPALPDNTLLLATIDVGAGATSISNANITDERVPYTSCAGGGSLLDVLVYDATGAFVKADYPAMTFIEVEVQGSGGGGGGAGSGHPKNGAGGGSGGYTRGIILESSLGASETVTVGAAGAGGVAGATGSNGATSSFGTHLVCAGGQGGESGGSGTFPGGGASGNVPTPGDIEIEGQYGEYGWIVDQGAGDYTLAAGAGADSPLGLGGGGYVRPDHLVGASTAGHGATGYGSGGGGAINTLAAGGGAANGGAGGPGLVIVRVYG